MTFSKPPSYLLPVIIFSQFAGTSLWFAGNAVIKDIQWQTGNPISVAFLTSVIQVGFIGGTFVFAIFAVADRYKSHIVFFISSVVAALANLCIIWLAADTFGLSVLRFITGFFLAGIYPVGMKIVADHFPQKLGNALGFLVGALVLGTAFPHLLASSRFELSWQAVIIATSILALFGGCLIFFLTPNKRTEAFAAPAFQPAAIKALWQRTHFRAAAIGYFGHMWELYTFWAFVPLIILMYNHQRETSLPVSLSSFLIIGVGSIACIVGGRLSQKLGSKKVAVYSLTISGGCCLFSPLAFTFHPVLFLFFMCVWGCAVIADSPQFSSLVAQTSNPAQKGTALTIVTSAGFFITILSIQLMQLVKLQMGIYSFLILVPGPLIGLYFFTDRKMKRSPPAILEC